MKNLFFIIAGVLLMTSCYNTRMVVGNVRENEPLVEVSREWNHHIIFGLVPLNNATMHTEEYVGGYANYVVKTNTGFLNGLIESITFGIYTPTQTIYYIPLRDLQKTTTVVPPLKDDLELILD